MGDGAFHLAPERLVDLTKRYEFTVILWRRWTWSIRNRFDSRQSRLDPADRLHRFFVSHAIE